MTWFLLTRRGNLQSSHRGTEAEIRRLAEVNGPHVLDGPRELTESEAMTSAMRGGPFGLDEVRDESLRFVSAA